MTIIEPHNIKQTQSELYNREKPDF